MSNRNFYTKHLFPSVEEQIKIIEGLFPDLNFNKMYSIPSFSTKLPPRVELLVVPILKGVQSRHGETVMSILEILAKKLKKPLLCGHSVNDFVAETEDRKLLFSNANKVNDLLVVPVIPGVRYSRKADSYYNINPYENEFPSFRYAGIYISIFSILLKDPNIEIKDYIISFPNEVNFTDVTKKISIDYASESVEVKVSIDHFLTQLKYYHSIMVYSPERKSV